MLGVMPPKKKIAQTIVARGFADGGEVVAQAGEAESDDQIAMKAIGEDIMKAIETKNPLALAETIKTLFMIADALPHAEGPHSELED